MFTANWMNCLAEALGMALPGNGTILAVSRSAHELARAAARASADAARERHALPRHRHRRAIDNAMALDVAMGGSTNTVLHVLALAHEAGIDYPLARFNEVAERVPHLAKVSPAWDGNRQWHIQDVDAAGGVPAILAELARKPGTLASGRASPSPGSTLGENLEGVVISTIANASARSTDPHSARGALAVLFGNLAPDGAVIKVGAVEHHDGPSAVQRGYSRARRRRSPPCAGTISAPGCRRRARRGSAGGPGMREMLSLTSMLKGMPLGGEVALVTDGRFSGGTRGLCIGTSRRRRPRAVRSGSFAMATWSASICPGAGWRSS